MIHVGIKGKMYARILRWNGEINYHSKNRGQCCIQLLSIYLEQYPPTTTRVVQSFNFIMSFRETVFHYLNAVFKKGSKQF